MDQWHGLTIEDIRAIEEKTKKELDQVCLRLSIDYNYTAKANISKSGM